MRKNVVAEWQQRYNCEQNPEECLVINIYKAVHGVYMQTVMWENWI